VVWQAQAARRRTRAAREDGTHVPPIAIFSITNRCNLRCKGCYAQAIRPEAANELPPEKLRSIIAEADELGVSFFVIAGGEPLLRPEILEIAKAYPHIIFLLVTNGLLLEEPMVERLTAQLNTVPVLSIEGNQGQTDDRRGAGVHARLEQRMAELRAAGVFFSLSFTVTRQNFETVTDQAFLRRAADAGCKFFLLLEYTPIRAGTDEWVITDEQREEMKGIVAEARRQIPAVFIAVPWDEEAQGGCLAAGRGFVHISASGDLEPCPFAPYSDASLRGLPLRVALQSRFLTLMRENHELFAETEGGCALWKRRDVVEQLLQSGTR